MADKAKPKAKDKPKRKPPPKVTMEASVKGKLKGSQRDDPDYGYTSQATLDWSINSNGKVSIVASCGTTYNFDKETIRDFAALIDKAYKAKVTFD